MNTDKIFAEAIANEYSTKNTSKVVALKKLDQRAKLPANVAAYSIGILSALVLGVGIGAKIIAPTKIVYIDGSGFMVLADDEDDAIKLLREAKEKWNPDGWKIFEPKEG